jgi:hypothetical protein
MEHNTKLFVKDLMKQIRKEIKAGFTLHKVAANKRLA